ncbi:MAG: type VI secretion system baseplate subunit TssK, partial [Algicola sp.]|nr:type VI secretion system baseplate subunit TssK [Algicola sp.]
MSIDDKIPHPVCWHEGMLLSPQHFQQNHIYWEAQMQQLAINMTQYRWGIIELVIDEGRLLEGQVDITCLRAVLPDGLQVDFEAKDDGPLKLGLTGVDSLTKTGKVKVHLTVPIRVPGSASDSTDIQRFKVCDGKVVNDDNTGDGEMVMQRLQPILSLQAVEQVNKQYVSLVLFEVCQSDGGQYFVSSYCPPMLAIGSDNFLTLSDLTLERKPLQKRLQALALAIRKKARLLAGFSEEGGKELGTKITEQHQIWIRAMALHLVEFELLADNEHSLPWDVFQLLARMIGSISVLDPSGVPPKLASYQHHDIAASLTTVLKYINNQLDRVNLRYTSIVFDEGRDGVFTLTYDKAWAGRDLLIELKPRKNNTQADLVLWLKACRRASTSQHKALATKRLLGAEIEQVDSDDKTGITAPPGHALFKIKMD